MASFAEFREVREFRTHGTLHAFVDSFFRAIHAVLERASQDFRTRIGVCGFPFLELPVSAPEAVGSMTRISQTVRASHDPDGAVLLEVSEGKIYGLNPVASRILLLLAEGLGNEQIAAVISREFSTDLETVRKDVAEFLDQLAKYRLIAENNDLPENGKS